MIIVEGMDGTGKSRLVARISEYFNIPIHEKASDPILGPVNNLMEWAYHDVITQPEQPLSVYDRHPLISEYIYAPVCRTLRKEFITPAAHNLIRLCARQAFVVWCDPGYARVTHNLLENPQEQMDGVIENTGKIYDLYWSMRMFWPGQSTVYNYASTEQSELFNRLKHHIASFQMIRRPDSVV